VYSVMYSVLCLHNVVYRYTCHDEHSHAVDSECDHVQDPVSAGHAGVHVEGLSGGELEGFIGVCRVDRGGLIHIIVERGRV
jgi:hypothetical protein